LTEIAFVLGNGTSRQQIPIEKLKELGTVYGCNALYREHSVDHLVAVDTKMIREIYDSGYYLENKVYTNPNKFSKTLKGITILNPNKGWSSGPTAMFLASKNQHRIIYILGFDYVGLGEKNLNVNNMYAGTQNYKGVHEKATYYGNWQRQTMMCANQHPRVKYVRVRENKKSYIPDLLKDLPNVKHITIPEFVQKFSIKPLPN
jgi:hypothetical protein